MGELAGLLSPLEHNSVLKSSNSEVNAIKGWALSETHFECIELLVIVPGQFPGELMLITYLDVVSVIAGVLPRRLSCSCFCSYICMPQLGQKISPIIDPPLMTSVIAKLVVLKNYVLRTTIYRMRS